MSPRDTTEESRRATIRTVAEDAGVSVAAVSKVLRDAYGVSDALRARVNASIAKLGYRPSKAAQGLRGRSTTVGVLLVEIANPFLPAVIDGIQDTLAPSHFRAMIGVGRAQTHLETELIESMIDHGMAGVILVAPLLPREVVARYAQKIPTVLIAYHAPDAAPFDTVNSDDRRGGALAAQALIDRGHRDIGFLAHHGAGGRKPSVVREREAGYAEALTRAGLAPRVFDLTAPPEGRPAELVAFLARPDRPRAVVCWSDLDGLPLRALAAQAGLRVPGDLALVAYDNSPMAASPAFDLASIDQHGRELGRQAADVLLARLGGRSEARHLLVEPHLVVRSSI
ncbi:LacI family DNA-binding transcriptional regulator [Rubellimicrobium aerolatum]|uniref:LacI family DNA-binding transcriptional regulator n=1 Tax=Rubellimicrobium aerolatum TaxID=490979 RepID=A0ABW0SAA9_9RHOB|nr:LacI family DNA-binding transcriptional regulator [Rubellimicrobium aerolatum]MBP1805263.1 LacI family transcriptional regulator [Rubellimicrobium aerolatum]